MEAALVTVGINLIVGLRAMRERRRYDSLQLTSLKLRRRTDLR